ncbi:hypothetical protein MHUMG1_07111 [Metarhizium humberi]|uniref:Uncharacterized protein n=1 Tax=Metarhizium humberi TaxID=2596975 RepID=A0A9P8M9R6_9HYPO|nr:hypothetical protein MHUMG1_07111 [Metarhizium humberi]
MGGPICPRLSQRLQGFFSRRSKVRKNRLVTQDSVNCQECRDSDAYSASDPADAAADVEDHHVSDASHANCPPQNTQEDETQQPLTVRMSAGSDKTLAELGPTIRVVRDSSAPDESLLPGDSEASSGTQLASESLDDSYTVQPGLSSKCGNRSITKGKLKRPPVQFNFMGDKARRRERYWKNRTPSSESMVCEKALREEEKGAFF